MNDIIQNLEVNATNGKENFCYISEKQLKAMKELSKREAKESKQLKDNWNELKEYIRKNIIYDDIGMKILDPSPLEDYMQELEQGSDN